MEKRLTMMPTTKSGRAFRAARKLGGVNGVVQLMATSKRPSTPLIPCSQPLSTSRAWCATRNTDVRPQG